MDWVIVFVLAGPCAWFIGPQVVLSLFYALPRALYLCVRGMAPWSLAAEYIANPAIWSALVGAAWFFFPTFGSMVAGMGLIFGVWALLGSLGAARADFEEDLARARKRMAG